MNRWLLIRRLRGPAFLILVGITALLNQWGVLSFLRSWPLYLILAGILMLAERAALAGAAPSQLSPEPYASPADPSSSPLAGTGWNPVTTPAPAQQDAASLTQDDTLSRGSWRP